MFILTTILSFCSFNKWMKSQESVHSYDKLLELNSKNVVVLDNKGARLVEIGQYKEAINLIK